MIIKEIGPGVHVPSAPLDPLLAADPGFRIRGCADPPGASTYDFAKFPKKLHEIEKILGRRRGSAGSAAVDPPMATAFCFEFQKIFKIN